MCRINLYSSYYFRARESVIPKHYRLYHIVIACIPTRFYKSSTSACFLSMHDSYSSWCCRKIRYHYVFLLNGEGIDYLLNLGKYFLPGWSFGDVKTLFILVWLEVLSHHVPVGFVLPPPGEAHSKDFPPRFVYINQFCHISYVSYTSYIMFHPLYEEIHLLWNRPLTR